jgi:two-component system, NtrC family, sensor kinase
MAGNSFILQKRPSGQGRWNPVMAYGTSVVLLILAIPLGIQSGLPYAVALVLLAIASFIGVNQVHEQKAAAERETELQYEQLLQSQKLASIGELSAGIAHEINNPLAIIRQEAEWLLHLCKQEAAPDMAEVKNCLTEIVQQVDRGRSITENLLNFARKRQPVVQAVELNRLIEDMVRLVAKEASHNNIEVIQELCPELPLINSDAPLLRQVILNLLNNAVQAIGKDGTVTVITKVADDGQAVVHINDNGCGIARENLAQIFDPFFTTKPQGKGTGLGLSICHGIIERLGGKIAVASEVGQGTSFTLKLPQAVEAKGM